MTPANRRVPAARSSPVDPQPSGASGAPQPGFLRRLASVVGAAFGVALVVGTSVGAAWFARRYVTTSARFAVTEVKVSGNDRRAAATIVEESGIALGTNVFSVDLSSARSKILSDPWASEATVARRLPGTIVIQVTERKPAGLVAIGELLLCTSDGDPFKKFEPDDPVDLPLITGLTPESVGEDREAARRLIRRGIDLAAEYDRSALAKRAPLQEVHIDEGGAFTLVVGRPPVHLVLGGPPFRRKLDEAARVVSELDMRRAQASAIMLDNDVRPERVVARIRSAH